AGSVATEKIREEKLIPREVRNQVRATRIPEHDVLDDVIRTVSRPSRAGTSLILFDQNTKEDTVKVTDRRNLNRVLLLSRRSERNRRKIKSRTIREKRRDSEIEWCNRGTGLSRFHSLSRHWEIPFSEVERKPGPCEPVFRMGR